MICVELMNRLKITSKHSWGYKELIIVIYTYTCTE